MKPLIKLYENDVQPIELTYNFNLGKPTSSLNSLYKKKKKKIVVKMFYFSQNFRKKKISRNSNVLESKSSKIPNCEIRFSDMVKELAFKFSLKNNKVEINKANFDFLNFNF